MLYIYNTNRVVNMDLEARKYQFIQKVFTLNENLFEQLEKLLDKQIDNPKRINLEQYNKELEEAEKDIEAGNFFTHEEVLKKVGQWGRK